MKKFFLSGIAAFVLLFGAGQAAVADNPPGWNGDVKIHEGAGEPSPITKDEPKVCTFHIHGFNFDSQEHVDWWIIKSPPFTSLPVLTGSIVTDSDGAFVGTETTLSPDQYKLFWAGEQAGGAKHKVFKVECDEPSQSSSPEPSAEPSSSVTPSSEPTPSVSPSISPSPDVSPSPTPEESATRTPNVNRPGVTPPPTDIAGAAQTVNEQPLVPIAILVLAGGALGMAYFAKRKTAL